MAYVGQRLAPLFDVSLARDACHELAEVAREALLDRVRANTPVSAAPRDREPGALRDSWQRAPIRREPTRAAEVGYVAEVSSSDPVARWIEYGVEPHVIRARRGGVLRFRTSDGRWVTARVVRHPGIRAQYPMTRAVGQVEAEFHALAEPVLERWAKRATRAVR